MKGRLGRRASPDNGVKYLCGEMVIVPIIETLLTGDKPGTGVGGIEWENRPAWNALAAGTI